MLGLSSNPNYTFSDTAGCTANAVLGCVRFGTGYGTSTGKVAAGLLAVTEHEIDEVLGSSSGLNASGTGTTPSVADLFRYSAANTPSFSNNPGPTQGQACPQGTPNAYLSTNGGVTPIVYYNNCNNGGDYGDFMVNNPKLPQDFAASENDAIAGLTASSAETQLLDAIGFNLSTALKPATTSSHFGMATQSSSSSLSIMEYGGDDDGSLTDGQLEALQVADALLVPEPATLSLLGLPIVLAMLRRSRKPNSPGTSRH